MNVVNSFNEWDPLEEIIVGNGFPAELPFDDITFKLFFHDNIYGNKNTSFSDRWKISPKIIETHNYDIEQFVKLLKDNNINVRRPKTPANTVITKTLCWSSTNYPALNVRDLTLIIGNEIIETPVSARWRQFENDYMKDIFLEYFKKGAKWTSAPRPLVTDNSYDLSRIYKTEGAKEYYNSLKFKYKNYLDCGVEIMFDAANCIRLGDTILFNAPTEHERLGAEWLRRHLEGSFKVWEVNIADNHIDSVFLPLRPGLALLTQDIISKLPEQLQKWEFIMVPSEYNSEEKLEYLPIASQKIYCNILSISPNKIICMPEYYNILRDKLRKYNIEVIPNKIRYSRLFGGGHHCLSLDVRRKGEKESYFL